tara:strand:- start:2 stop:514 length:513 start_codon:yes stop_codon:yes gene_type:complete
MILTGISDLIINDIGNVQLHEKHRVQLTQIDDTKVGRAIVTDQHLIDKLLIIKKLTAQQHLACNKYLLVINSSGAYAKGSSCWSDHVSSGNNPSKPTPKACILLKVQRRLKKEVGRDEEKVFWKIMVNNPSTITKDYLKIIVSCSESLISHYWYDQEPINFFQQVLSDQH